ncbi:TonB-dependent receptor [Sphingomonas gei]|uniref:TonB-dependent receptor n=1 Tax=Sphingomonas gei TaxID=1395960 RepID=UPI001440EA2C|nr:TonB-dependent receptor [Sphingomonas gei]
MSATAAALSVFFAVPARAQLTPFDIPAQRLETAVSAFGKQANVQIIAARAITKGKRSPTVRGHMTPREALAQLLAGTGLVAQPTGPQTFAIVVAPPRPLSRVAPPVRRAPGSRNGKKGGENAPRPLKADRAIPVDDELIVVRGYRESLASSAFLKRDAELITDSVSAEDVGKFPDSNIAESLQRITGVAIDRSGGEGQFITVRGLGPEFNTVLVNGRMMATDNPGREFSFDGLSSTMIQRADVYKSSIASLQEGGIGATVNIVTARPLEGKSGFHAAVAAGGIYDDLRRKARSDLSAVMSLSNEGKTVGLVLSASFTDRESQSDAVQIDGWLFSPQTVLKGNGQSAGLTGDDLVEMPTVHVPQNLNFAREQSRRRRINAAATFAAQLNPTMTLSLDGLYSKLDAFSDRAIFANFYSSPYIGLAVDENRTATGFDRPGQRFLLDNPALADRLSLSQNDNIVQSSDRLTQSYQLGANLRWKPSANFEVRLDASKTGAVQHSPGSYVVVGSFAKTSPHFDLNQGGDLPIAYNIGDLADPALLGAHYTRMDQGRVLDLGSEYRLDGGYTLQAGILQSVGFGMAYARRSKVRRYFENIDAVCAYCGYETPVDVSLLRPYRLDRFLTGASGSDDVPREFFTFDPRAIVEYLSDPINLARPRQGRNAQEQAAEAARLLALPGGPFGTRENLTGYSDVRESLVAGYVALQFGGSAWGGNAGLRVVRTATNSSGYDVPMIGVTVTPGDDTLQFAYGPAAAVAVRNSYVTALPSANLKLKLRPEVIARAAFSQTITRPTLTELGVGNTFGGRVSAPLSSGGNPGLRPFRSTNFDVSLEWYLSRVSYLSVGGFYKDLRDFLELQALPVERFGRIFLDTRTRNGQTGYIRGVELGGQYLFDWLPGSASGLGISGNYTYVESKARRELSLADYDCGYNGLSPHSANGSVFYERSGLSIRAAYNWRSSYLRSCRSDQARPRNRSSYGQLDLNLSLDIANGIQIYAQGINVTDARVHEWSAKEDRFLMLQSTGARYNFGIRFKY